VPVEDRFTPNHPLPLERGERGLLLLLNATILAITTILIGIAITLSLGNPVKVFGDKASLTDNSALQPLPVQSTSTTQSAADAQALPPARGTRDEVATATADQSQGDITEATSDALFRQFQAWAAKQDVPAEVERVQPAQDVRAQDLQEAPVPPVQKRQRSQSVQNARAEIRRLRHPQATIRQDQNLPAPTR